MRKTKFFNVHKKLGAKIVDFAGYQMPIQYSSIIAEHKAVRNTVGVFDVSHMGEIFITGEEALSLVQYITVNDAAKLFPGRVQYSAICYPDGGIVDDLLVYMISNHEYMLVVNASNIEKDFNWIVENNKFNAQVLNKSESYSLLAIQGPMSKKVLQKFSDKDINLEYYHFFNSSIAGVEMIISRTGYTGEMGYELYFNGNEENAEVIWNKIFEAGQDFQIVPAGLGARDTLRLEMGFCLYGNDIDKTTNPLEAGLGWISRLNKENFIGKKALLDLKNNGVKRKLVAITSEEKSFPRHGYEIASDHEIIGSITSGTVSPVLDKAIALGYVTPEYSAVGSDLYIIIRGKRIPAKVVKLPFVNK